MQKYILEFDMKLTFRWYGLGDRIPLDYIRQIPNMYSVVTAVYDVPVGEVWPRESIATLVREAEAHGLKAEVIESVPVRIHLAQIRPGGDFLGIKLLDFDQDGQIIGITANGNMFANIVGFIAGAMVIKKAFTAAHSPSYRETNREGSIKTASQRRMCPR